MRLRTKLFLTWGGLVLMLWAGTLWPVQRTIASNFANVASEGFAGTKQSLDAVQAERVKRMRQACWLVMNIPELRALIAEHNYELSADNLSSLEERLDSLTDMIGVSFVCVLDNRGNLIAQNRQSPWPTLKGLQDYFAQSPQADALVHRIFSVSTTTQSANGSSDAYGLWVNGGKLYQVVGVPLIFRAGDEGTAAETDGALVMATPITDDLAAELGKGHNCQVSFLSQGAAVASSLPAGARDELVQQIDQTPGEQWTAAGTFDITLEQIAYRSSVEPLLDPCSGAPVGAMLIQSSLTNARGMQSRILHELLAILVTGLFSVALGSFLLSGAVTKPVGELVDGVKQVAGGNLELALPASRRDELGELAAAFNDMVAQLRSRRELQRLVEESQAASRAKSQFLANMSHEIRTPLNGVIGMADLLLVTEMTERQRRYASLVKSSAEVLTTLINDTLDFSKIEAGKMEIESIDFDLHVVVEEVVEMLAPKALKKKLEVACDISTDVPAIVRGDPNRLRQIIINLFNNAIKFTETGEVVVRVRTENRTDQKLAVRIAVHDTGIGIPPERMDRLFKSFSQVDASTTRKYGGTGLGLAISKQLAELMGGAIGVESEAGKGSTFWFSVLLEAGEKQPSAGPKWNDRLELKGTRVLVAEEHASTREIVARRLNEWGMDVTAIDGGDLPATMNATIAIIGESLARLAAQPSLSGASKLLLVNSDREVDATKLKDDGFSGYVTKPIRQRQLADAVLHIISPPSAADPSAVKVAVVPASAVRKAHILLAEDNEVNQLVVTELLANAGYRCDVVGDGIKAVDAAMTGAFDLVLMDCQMPGMDGFEATGVIREKERTGVTDGNAARHIPIVALTANAVSGDRQRCLDAGMDGYCTKPIDAKRLVETIQGLLKDRPAAACGLAKQGDLDCEAAARLSSPKSSGDGGEKTVPVDVESLLRRCSNKPSLAGKVLEKLSAQAAKSLTELRTCITEKDAAHLARVAHSLKGAAGMASAKSLQSVAARLEEIGRASEMDHADECLSRLQEEVRRCNEFITEAMKRLSNADNKESVVTEVSHASADR